MNHEDLAVVYIADRNIEAHQIVHMLTDNGIEAFVEEDHSVVGFWTFGILSQIHQPKIWVRKDYQVMAAQLIDEFETKKSEREPATEVEGEGILAVCEECNKESYFSAELNGTTQECPHCHAYMDVGEFRWEEDQGPS